MPLILTDDYIRKNCMSAYPVPLKALKGLKPNADKTPNYISKRGRSGIRPADMPIYAPASVGSLAKSISNISKLEPAVVETYLENMINNMSPMEELENILMEQGEMDFLRTREGDEETKAEELVKEDVRNTASQSSISFFSEEEREFIESDPELRKIFEVEPRADRELKANPRRFRSGSGRAAAGTISQTRASFLDPEEMDEETGAILEFDPYLREEYGARYAQTQEPRIMKVKPGGFSSGSGRAAAGVGSDPFV